MNSVKSTRCNLDNKYCGLAIIFSLAMLLLIGCTQQSSTPELTHTPTTMISPIQDIDANIQAVEYGHLGSLTDRMKHYNVAGVSIAVINHGVIEWARGYGVVDADTKQSVTENTLFQAASISKPVAAMAALHYVQTGVLSLDENVNNKLTSWKIPDNKYTQDSKVTLRALLSHSAGLTVQGFGGYAANDQLPTLLQILNGESTANSEPIRVFVTPSTRWQYSGGGYVVVQQLLEDVTGKPFTKIMQETVLQKLGMVSSTYEQPLPLSLSNLAATGHNNAGKVISDKWRIYPEMAAAGLWTTPSDLARFIIEIQRSATGNSNQIISTEMTQEMVTRQIGEWGLGLQVGGSGDDAWFAHEGGNKGFKCYMFGFVKNGQGAVVMTNSDNGYKLALEIIRTISTVYKWPSMP